jgi:hypothetical protein
VHLQKHRTERVSRSDSTDIVRPTRSRRGLIIALFGMLAVGTLIVAAHGPRLHPMSSAASIICDSPSIDLGQINRETAGLVHHTFVLHNAGRRTVRITSSKSTCGCTTAFYDSAAIRPGGECPIHVQVNWSGRAGAQTAQVLLATDDVKTPQILLRLVGHLLTGTITASPALLNFGVLRPGQHAERIVDIGGPLAPTWAVVTAVHVPDDAVSVKRLSPIAGAPEGVLGPPGRFQVRLENALPASIPSPEVVFDTTLSEAPHIRIAIVAREEPIITPSSVFWPDARPEIATNPQIRYVSVSAFRESTRGGLSGELAVALVHRSEGVCPFSVVHDRVTLHQRGAICVVFDSRAATGSFSFATLRFRRGGDSWDVSLVGVKAAAASTIHSTPEPSL